MQNVLFIFDKQNSRTDYLKNILSKEYSVLEAHSYDEAFGMLQKMSFNDVAALIVDYPSQFERFEELNNYIKGRTNYLFNRSVMDVYTGTKFHQIFSTSTPSRYASSSLSSCLILSLISNPTSV